MSFSTLLLAILFCGLTAANTGADVDTILAQYKQSMQTLWNMRNDRSVYVNQNDDACFDWYFATIDDNMNTYWNHGADCNWTAYSQIKLLNHEDRTRYDLVDRKRSICQNYELCEEKSDLLQFYDCYGYVSNNNTPTIFNMSADSSAWYKILLVKYNNVEANKNLCHENVRDEYMKNSAETDRQFLACRAGDWVPPRSTLATPTDEPTDVPTDEPTAV